MATPSFALEQTAARIRPYFKDGGIIAIATKGLEENSCKRFSQIVEETLPTARVAVLSGPSHAEEVHNTIGKANDKILRNNEHILYLPACGYTSIGDDEPEVINLGSESYYPSSTYHANYSAFYHFAFTSTFLDAQALTPCLGTPIRCIKE